MVRLQGKDLRGDDADERSERDQWSSRDTHGHASSTVDMVTTAKLVFACLLIVAGLSVAGWIIAAVVTTINSEQPPMLVQKLTPSDAADATLHIPDGPIQVPPKFFVAVGYLLTLLGLGLVGGMAVKILKAGTYLLQPEVKRVLKNLVTQLKMSNSTGGSD